jgi:Domain of unknown function (DUF1741)
MWNTLFMVMRLSIGAPNDIGGMIGAGGSGSATASGSGGAGVQYQQLSKQQLGICMQVVTVLNLFITYGDSFLPSPSDYDDLYYEIMRVSKLLDHFYNIAEKFEHASFDFTPPNIANYPTENITGDDNTLNVAHEHPSNSNGTLATLSMLNIKTIITHFSGKIQQWNFAHPEVTLTPDMVLRIIKDNYDSLKLKLQENLDFYEECIQK